MIIQFDAAILAGDGVDEVVFAEDGWTVVAARSVEVRDGVAWEVLFARPAPPE